MNNISLSNKKISEEKIIIDNTHQKIANKKIYFDSDKTEIKIGYNEEIGIGFVEFISE